MKRLSLLASGCAVSLVVAACASGAAPATTAPPASSVVASPAGSSPASTRPPRATLPPPPTALSVALKVQRTKPAGMLAADGSLWVAESASGSLIRLDPTTGKVQATIGGLADGLRDPFEGAGRIWVPSANSLAAVNPMTNKVVLSLKGSYSMTGAVAGGHVWIGDGHDRLLELDATTGATLHQVSVGGPGENVGESCSNTVSAGAGAIWWSVNDAGVIVRVDPGTAQTTAQMKNVGTTSVAVVDGTPWAVSNSGNVLALDPATGSVATTVNFLFAVPDVCAGPLVPDGTSLWFYDGRSACGCGSGSSPLYRFDTASKAITGSYDPGDTGTQSIAVANHSLWLDFSPSGAVERYDPPFP